MTKVHQFVNTPEGIITLKAVKVFHEMSEETLACRANVYVDNKKVGTIENDGRGGPTFFRETKKGAEAKLDSFFKKLPPQRFHDMDLPWHSDFYFAKLVEMYAFDEDVYKQTKNGRNTVFFENVKGFINNIVGIKPPTTMRVVNIPYNQEAHEYIIEHTASGGGDDVFIYNKHGSMFPGIVFPTEARLKKPNQRDNV